MENSICSTGLTKVEKSSHIFTWNLENFDTYYVKLRSKDAGKICSPVFEVLHPDGSSIISWEIELEVVEVEKVDAYLHLKGCPSVYLNQGGGLPCIFSLRLGTQNNSKFYRQEASYNYMELGDGWGWAKFVALEKLRGMGLLPGDSLQVRVELTIFGKPQTSIISTHSKLQVPALTSPVNFECLLTAPDHSDIKIICGSETFPAHRVILAVQSPVFKVMLSSNMEEVKSGVINITDMTAATFGILLRYIYTGKVDEELDSDSLLDVIYGAEKYGLTGLKNYCFRKLVACICEDNVGALAVAAHLYGAEESFKMTVQKFIEPKCFVLMKKQEFKNLVDKHRDAFF